MSEVTGSEHTAVGDRVFKSLSDRAYNDVVISVEQLKRMEAARSAGKARPKYHLRPNDVIVSQ